MKSGIIDCDIHHIIPDIKALFPYLPRRYKDQIILWGPLFGGGPGRLNGGKSGRRVDSYPPTGGPPCSDLAFMTQQHLDPFNIKYGILTGEFMDFNYISDPYYAAALCSAWNDYTIEHWLEKDARLRGSVYIPVYDIEASIKEIERIGSHPQMVQVYVPNGTQRLYGQKYYHPIYEACVKHNLAFTIHVGGEGKGMNPSPTGAGYPSYYVEYRAIRPQMYMAHMTSFIFEGVFEIFPELQVVFLEAGVFWIAPFFWRLDQDWKALRDQTPWVKKKPSEYLQSNIYFGSQPIEETPNQQIFQEMLKYTYAKERLIFCSDYPHWDFDSPKLAIPKMDKEHTENIYYNNAARLYGLPQLEKVGK